jgi:hypothetical protein
MAATRKPKGISSLHSQNRHNKEHHVFVLGPRYVPENAGADNEGVNQKSYFHFKKMLK